MPIFGFSPPLFWFVLGVAFFVLEAATPGFFLLFFGLGAFCAAVAVWLAPLSPAIQLAIFMAVSVASLAAFRRRLKAFFERRGPKGRGAIDDPVFAGQFIGREATVLKDIAPGHPGLAELNGTNWRASSGAPLSRGQRATVRAIDGLTLVLEPQERID